MIQIHHTPSILKRIYPSLIWNIQSEDTIFLTFDDGPHPEITSWVLEILDKYNAKATFFCVGENLAKHQEVARKVIMNEHKIANHTKSHAKGWKTKDELYMNDIDACNKELEELGVYKNTLFRPPYGRIKKSQIQKLNNYKIIMWSHLSWDFDKNLNLNRSIRNLEKVVPGSIIVFHDSEKSFGNLKRLLPPLMEYWCGKGYKFGSI